VIEIPADIRDQMVEHAVASLPSEACGLLAGRDGRVEHYFPIRNVHKNPETRYELESKEKLRALDEIEGSGRQLTATFHSHTHSAPYPSRTDVEQSEGIQRFYPDARFVLVSLQDEKPELRAFTITGNLVNEEELRIG